MKYTKNNGSVHLTMIKIVFAKKAVVEKTQLDRIFTLVHGRYEHSVKRNKVACKQGFIQTFSWNNELCTDEYYCVRSYIIAQYVRHMDVLQYVMSIGSESHI